MMTRITTRANLTVKLGVESEESEEAEKSWEWQGVPVTPAHGRQRQEDLLQVQDQPRLHSKF